MGTDACRQSWELLFVFSFCWGPLTGCCRVASRDDEARWVLVFNRMLLRGMVLLILCRMMLIVAISKQKKYQKWSKPSRKPIDQELSIYSTSILTHTYIYIINIIRFCS